jgi:hypothetical protein
MTKNNPSWILLHTTDYPRSKASVQFWLVNRWHKDRGFSKHSLGYYGGYHYLYEADGTEMQFRKEEEEGAHCNIKVDGVSMNFQSIGLCFSGDGDIEQPTGAQEESMRKRIQTLQKKYGIPNNRVKFDRDFATWKTCPGTMFTREYFENRFLKDPPEEVLIKPNPIELSFEKKNRQALIDQYSSSLDRIRLLVLQIQELLKGRS